MGFAATGMGLQGVNLGSDWSQAAHSTSEPDNSSKQPMLKVLSASPSRPKVLAPLALAPPSWQGTQLRTGARDQRQSLKPSYAPPPAADQSQTRTKTSQGA